MQFFQDLKRSPHHYSVNPEDYDYLTSGDYKTDLNKFLENPYKSITKLNAYLVSVLPIKSFVDGEHLVMIHYINLDIPNYIYTEYLNSEEKQKLYNDLKKST